MSQDEKQASTVNIYISTSSETHNSSNDNNNNIFKSQDEAPKNEPSQSLKKDEDKSLGKSVITVNTESIAEQQDQDHIKLTALRLSSALAQLSKTRRDSPSMRLWDVVILGVILGEYTRFTFELSGMWGTDSSFWMASGVTGVVMSTFLLADFAQHLWFLHPADRRNVPRWRHILNLVTAFPYDVILMGLGSSVVSVGLRVALRAIPATRVLTVPWMFPSESPDFVDVLYIRFYYQWVPKIRLVVYSLLMLHTFAILHVMASGGDERVYATSLMWVWVLTTSAPLSVEPTNDMESLLAGILMLVSMLIQGYAVSAVTSIVLGFDVQEQNRNHMLVTLEMLRYYKVPRELQEEVLSFQYHVLQDSSMQTHFAPALQQLPPNMLNEIQLCATMGVLDKAAFFDLASKECKTALAKAMVQVLVDPMTDIIRAGEVGTSMYFMMHGLADVTLMNGLVVATLRRGDFFGEMALINTDARRMATVCSLTYCDVLELQKTDFDVAITMCSEFRNLIETKRKAFIPDVNPIIFESVQPPVHGSLDVNDTELGISAEIFNLVRYSSVVGRRSTNHTITNNNTNNPNLGLSKIDLLASFPSKPLKRLFHSSKSTANLDLFTGGDTASNHQGQQSLTASQRPLMNPIPTSSTMHDMFASQDNNVVNPKNSLETVIFEQRRMMNMLTRLSEDVNELRVLSKLNQSSMNKQPSSLEKPSGVLRSQSSRSGGSMGASVKDTLEEK